MIRCASTLIIFFFCISIALAKPYLKIQQVRSIDYPYIKVEISLANITPIKGIGSNSFEIYENDWKVNSFHVKKVEPNKNPKKVILLVNSSRIISTKQFDAQLTAIKNFTTVLNHNDKMTLLSYNDNVINHCGFSSEKLGMDDCIKSVQQIGHKAVLYDALFEGLKLSQSLKPERNCIILFTDGRDEGSLMVMEDITTQLNQSNIPIFVISTGDESRLRPISRITRISGGDLYRVNHLEDLSKIYLLINELLDNSYIIHYVSQAGETSSDGKTVRLLARVNAKDFSEEDTYTFFLHDFSFTSLWHKIKTDNRYWFFGIGGGGLLLFFLLIIMVIHRPRYILTEKERNHKQKMNKNETDHDIQDYIIGKEEINESPVKKQVAKRRNALQKSIRGYLVEKEGPNTGRKYELNWENISIGYSEENSVSLDDPLVSYEHAKIRQESNHFILYDLLSENGTYLNGKKLLRPHSLRDFDEIQLGRTKLIFRKVTQNV